MSNEYGEYLNYRIINAQNEKERAYYEELARLNANRLNNDVSYADSSTNQAYVPIRANGRVSNNYKNITPTTVDNDIGLQQDILDGSGGDDNYEDNDGLHLSGRVWDGMESGAVRNRPSTQSSRWESTIPYPYRKKAIKWSKNQGIVEIIPREQRQKYTYSTIAYIANNQNEPKTQRFPVSDVSVIPHQINFDFYDTTEGRIGVANAVEKHMSVEFDVYLTDYVFYGWNMGGDGTNKYYLDVPDKIKKIFWESIRNKTYTDKRFLMDIETTEEFTTFRNTFLQQHLGWVCDFNSHIFGKFTGVINDVSFQISSGESFAKWHVKLEEAIFTNQYSTTGQKPESTTSDNASSTNSGSAIDTEDIDI